MRGWILLGIMLASTAEATVTRDANGWTVVTASGDSRIVYVSSSDGNDTDSGLTEALAKQTLAAGKGLMRDNMPDQLLLKKGDVWHEGFGSWNVSGRSLDEPMLIGAYGTGTRPSVQPPGATSGFSSGDSPATVYVAIIGIEFYSYTRDPANGAWAGFSLNRNPTGVFFSTSADLLLEDCWIRFFQTNLLIQATLGNSNYNNVIRRNVITDAWAMGDGIPPPPNNTPHSQGFFGARNIGMVVEENFFHHNGYLVRDNDTEEEGGATVFNHNVYLGGGYDVGTGPMTFRQNITAQASSHGFQRPPGSVVYNNLAIQNPLGLVPQTHDGASITATYNVVEGSEDLTSVLNRGSAFRPLLNNDVGSVFKYNLSIHSAPGTGNFHGMGFDCCASATTDGSCGGTYGTCSNIIITNNIWYDWPEGCPVMVGGTLSSPVIENNVYSGVESACASSGTNVNGGIFPDNTRSVATYNSIVRGGAATRDAFLAAARLQSKDTFDPTLLAKNVNNWIRAGFFVSPTPALTGGAVSGGTVR